MYDAKNAIKNRREEAGREGKNLEKSKKKIQKKNEKWKLLYNRFSYLSQKKIIIGSGPFLV